MKNAVSFGSVALCLALSLAGCREETAAVPSGPTAVGNCGAAQLQGLVGQPKTVLEKMRFSQRVRVIAPNSQVTMDYAPARLNIEWGRAQTIERVFCG